MKIIYILIIQANDTFNYLLDMSGYCEEMIPPTDLFASYIYPPAVYHLCLNLTYNETASVKIYK